MVLRYVSYQYIHRCNTYHVYITRESPPRVPIKAYYWVNVTTITIHFSFTQYDYKPSHFPPPWYAQLFS